MFNISQSNRILNKYPLWKYILLVVVIILGFIYAIPNLFGENPAIQISANSSTITIDNSILEQVEKGLRDNKIMFISAGMQGAFVQVRFSSLNDQLAAQSAIKNILGEQYTVALSLAPATPSWLSGFNAEPMKLGLDLRGGVHFLLDVDVKSVLVHRLDGDVKNISDELRNDQIRYLSVSKQNENTIQLNFRDKKSLDDAYDLLQRRYSQYQLLKSNSSKDLSFTAVLTPQSMIQAQDYVMDQTMTTLRNRVNELGISEALVQRQGADRVSVDLPGVLDAGRAKQILGGTATLDFHLVDDENDAKLAMGGTPPYGTRLYMYEGRPYLLKNQVVLHGYSITNASSSFGDDGLPSVNITLGGGGESYFNRITRENINKPLAIVYVETKPEIQMIDGKQVKTYRKDEHVINVANIKGALGTNFQITGLNDAREAGNLALLLRAGALPANIDIAQEKTVGPSLGKENIQKSILSIEIAFCLVVIFMALYYNLFGLVADVALFINLVLLVALLSILGMTLTLPGIAGILLTVGMAVDANVLIFERIREELRNGVSPQAAIHAGYERAFATIVDANVTTLIAAFALFAFGTGPIKGFSVTLTIGILTSMLTAITFTRAMVNLIYGGRQVKTLSIGI